ncbi:hypothetical protein PtrM4_110060 [Pyrenophora tritici-repentis]|uniref:Uncharacterized protein n=1 Tax=Pyrenophora tritici-repentis TaxID=45151 RepID=A0A834RWH8_9PLEO|nr:hypothetical protein PtrM4_110060 [Pyrenophora tritici-repentis]KAI1514114.1 hypothetical protein Ptr86124_006744 [Pyrenophora tritici-repentis]KAI1682520.1 hypothetical protein KJE20_07252 [Pyrenophora tritici-repentis]
MLRHSLAQHWLHFADPRIACPTRTTNHPLDALDSHLIDSSLRHRYGVGTTRKNAESSPQLNLTKNVHDVGQRRMKPADTTNTSSIQSRPFGILVPPEGPVTLDFTTPLPKPDMNLTFLPRPTQSRPGKRSRAIADIDGEHSCTQKKKRRLRLVLITSRLSPQFSHPATNIVDRGSSKIAVWAKQKALGRNLLRKAAILNGIRRRNMSSKGGNGGRRGRILVGNEKEQAQFELARLEFDHGSIDTYTRPVLSQDPSVPPSGLVRTGDHFVVSGSPSTSPTSSRSPSPTPPASPMKSSPEDTKAFRSPNETLSRSHTLSLALPRAQIPRRDYTPPPPSPLGISNYDALDVEHASFDPYAHLDDDGEGEDERLPSPFDDEDDDAVSFPRSTHPCAVAQTCRSDTASLFSEFLDPPAENRDWSEGEDEDECYNTAINLTINNNNITNQTNRLLRHIPEFSPYNTSSIKTDIKTLHIIAIVTIFKLLNSKPNNTSVPEFLSYNPIVNVHIAEFPPSRYDREDDDAVYTALADVAGIGESKVGVAEFWG